MEGMDLKVLRIRARIPQHKVAARMGICATVLASVENGRRPVKEAFEKRAIQAIEALKEERGRR